LIEVEIKPLRLARVQLPDFHPNAPGFDDIFGFLVRDGVHLVLLDTGVGVGSRLIDRLYQPRRVELSVALSDAGVSIDQITAIVNSHLHFDHCGNNSLFPGLPILVQEVELEAAKQPNYTVPKWVDFPGANYTPVHGRVSISTHLELLPTPGHTPGHQSLVVHSSRGVELVIAQAAHTAKEFDGFLSGRFEVSDGHWSPESYVSSLTALQQLHPRRAFFSHDPLAWERAA
jgi:glyoxylase-like metal-dependent hydrolase (beta-lactamase superfamily II)